MNLQSYARMHHGIRRSPANRMAGKAFVKSGGTGRTKGRNETCFVSAFTRKPGHDDQDIAGAHCLFRFQSYFVFLMVSPPCWITLRSASVT